MPGVLESYDLTAIQSGMLVHALRSPGRGLDIQQIVARQPEAYDRDAFAAAWAAVMARHPALRTAAGKPIHRCQRQTLFITGNRQDLQRCQGDRLPLSKKQAAGRRSW